jgi:5-methylcytosine-specific restriction endonuclease McrA
MVMQLPPPAACSLDLVDLVVAERQNGIHANFFTGIAGEWRDRVQTYLDYGGSPEHVPSWPEIALRKKTFHNLYKSADDESAHGLAMASIRNHDLDLCPACGEPGVPNTLDHYLPKGAYPHFAITPINLFPMCDACQLKKLEKTGDAHNARYFIHPYFDVFSIPKIVDLVITPPFAAPTFELIPSPALLPAEAALVTTHLRELDIPGRYVRFFRAEHRRLIRNVTTMRASGQAVAETIGAFRDGHADPTPNSWQHIFYSAVLENEDLLEFLINGDLPAYP